MPKKIETHKQISTHLMNRLFLFLIVFVYMFSSVSNGQNIIDNKNHNKKSYAGFNLGTSLTKKIYRFGENPIGNISLFDKYNYGFNVGFYYLTQISDSIFFTQLELNYSYMRYDYNYFSTKRDPVGSTIIDSADYVIHSSSIQPSFILAFEVLDKPNIYFKIGPFINIPIVYCFKGTFIRNLNIVTIVSDTTSPYGFYSVETKQRTVQKDSEIGTIDKASIGLLVGVSMSFPFKENMMGIELRTYFQSSENTDKNGVILSLSLAYQF